MHMAIDQSRENHLAGAIDVFGGCSSFHIFLFLSVCGDEGAVTEGHTQRVAEDGFGKGLSED